MLYLLKEKDSEFLCEWYRQNSSAWIDIVDYLVIGHGIASIRFRTYSFQHDLFDEFVNVEKVRIEIESYFKQTSTERSPKGIIGKVLFMLPPKTDDAYMLSDIKKYCSQHNIEFEYEDQFVDE